MYKRQDTVIAPDVRAVIEARASPWLPIAGAGDVLAGAIGALLSRGLPPFDAAQAAVWPHGELANCAGKGLAADDLARRSAEVL